MHHNNEKVKFIIRMGTPVQDSDFCMPSVKLAEPHTREHHAGIHRKEQG